MKQESVSKFFNVDDSQMIFCGMAIGYKDQKAAINQFRTERQDFEDWCKVL